MSRHFKSHGKNFVRIIQSMYSDGSQKKRVNYTRRCHIVIQTRKLEKLHIEIHYLVLMIHKWSKVRLTIAERLCGAPHLKVVVILYLPPYCYNSHRNPPKYSKSLCIPPPPRRVLPWERPKYDEDDVGSHRRYEMIEVLIWVVRLTMLDRRRTTHLPRRHDGCDGPQL